jgi:selenide,water dikinase
MGNRRLIAADEIIWVTQAGVPAWLRETGRALDDQRFILVNDRLQSVSDPKVFAAGDIASTEGRPLGKAGVFAVRMGKPLERNPRRSLAGEPLAGYRPQRRWLALISTGDRHAVASRGTLGFPGEWVWRWKDWIDQRFMRRFPEFPKMDPAAQAAASKAEGVQLTAAAGGLGDRDAAAAAPRWAPAYCCGRSARGPRSRATTC